MIWMIPDGRPTMDGVHAEFGWKAAGEGFAHSYIVPTLLNELDEVDRTRGRLAVLDIGCGNGYVTAKIAGLGHQVVGVDVSRGGIEIARAAYPHVRFEVMSLYDERFEESVGGSVDCVVAVEVVEHLFYPRRLLEISHRVLRSGGLLLLTTPYHGYLKNLAISVVNGWDRHFSVYTDGGHIKFFSKKTLRLMAVSCGFSRVRFRGVGRVPWLWKSVLMIAEKASQSSRCS